MHLVNYALEHPWSARCQTGEILFHKGMNDLHDWKIVSLKIKEKKIKQIKSTKLSRMTLYTAWIWSSAFHLHGFLLLYEQCTWTQREAQEETNINDEILLIELIICKEQSKVLLILFTLMCNCSKKGGYQHFCPWKTHNLQRICWRIHAVAPRKNSLLRKVGKKVRFGVLVSCVYCTEMYLAMRWDAE